jgi:ADP-ribose pyrophosphatase
VKSPSSWRTIGRHVLLDRSPWLRVISEDLLLPNGRRVNDYLQLEAPDFVVVVALTEQGHMVLLQCYKHGLEGTDLQPAAGYLEPDETPEQAARRELLEETGFQAGELQLLGTCVVDGNRGAGHAHMFLATGCRQISKPQSGDLEEQQVLVLPLNQAFGLWRAGEFGQLGPSAAMGLALDRLSTNSRRKQTK